MSKIRFEPLMLALSAFRALSPYEIWSLRQRHNFQINAFPVAYDDACRERYRYSIEFCQGANVQAFMTDFELLPDVL
jgi:hypothetical protein